MKCLLCIQGVLDWGRVKCIYGSDYDVLFSKSSPHPVSLSSLGDFVNRVFVEFECLGLSFIFLNRTDYVIYLLFIT